MNPDGVFLYQIAGNLFLLSFAIYVVYETTRDFLKNRKS